MVKPPWPRVFRKKPPDAHSLPLHALQMRRGEEGGALPTVRGRPSRLRWVFKGAGLGCLILCVWLPRSPSCCPAHVPGCCTNTVPHCTAPVPHSLDMSASKSENGDAHRLDPELAVSDVCVS